MPEPKKRDSREQFLYEYCGSQGAQTPDRPPYANPGLRPYTPPVKNSPGAPPPPSNDNTIDNDQELYICQLIFIDSNYYELRLILLINID